MRRFMLVLAGIGVTVGFLPYLFRFLYLPENPFVFDQLHITLPIILGAVFFGLRIGQAGSAYRLRWAFVGPIIALFAATTAAIMAFSFVQEEFHVKDLWALLTFVDGFRADADLGLGIRLHGAKLAQYFLSFAFFVVATAWLVRRSRLLGLLVSVFSMWLISLLPGIHQTRPEHALLDAQRDIVEPVILERPEHKKNLILYYFEGMEERFAEIPDTGKFFQDLINRASKGLRLRGVGQLPGMEYSIAGYVASQCGVPLAPKGRQARIWGNTPDFIEREGFMPSINCLGDILAADGYATSFVHGMDLHFFGIQSFLESHSYQRLVGKAEMKAAFPDLEENQWGVADSSSHQALDAELDRLLAGSQPFLLTYENLATHGPSGFPDKECGPLPPGMSTLTFSVKCANLRLAEFLDGLDRRGLSENTIVVVLSDHLMLHSDLAPQLEALDGPRSNLFVILNSPHQKEIADRMGSMADVYPTLLEVMGYRIKDSAAGLGRSFLADTTTFVEKHGLEKASSALLYNGVLVDRLWRPE